MMPNQKQRTDLGIHIVIDLMLAAGFGSSGVGLFILLRSQPSMRIKQVDVYQVKYRLHDQTYSWSGGHSVSAFVSNIIRISTDGGVDGYGEVCPLGSAYMDAFARGVPSGIEELAPSLIGQDPTRIRSINAIMDSTLGGHNYVKSPIDIACWDILGKVTNKPVSMLLGGRAVEDYPLYRAIPQRSPKEMAKDVAKYRSQGYRKFQLKVGGDPDTDIKRIVEVLNVLKPGDVLVADANTGWLPHQAIRVVNALAKEDFYVEAPCATYEECLTVRQHTKLPFIIDELITGVTPFLRAYSDHLMDVVNIKISRVGGLTKALQLRNLCESLGIVMTIEDSWGGDVTTATIAHLAGSTRPELLFTSTDFNSYIDLHVAEDAPMRKEGRLSVPAGAGLGITVDAKRLGKPVVSIK
jgi:L-alanine-DL-glutamate epimerase-like enolase superfamily enzyme